MGGVAIQRLNNVTGNPFYYEAEATITPGVQQTLLNFTVPASEIRVLHLLQISCRFEGDFRVELDGALIGSGRTSPAEPNAVFTWAGGRTADENLDVEVKFTSRTGAPNTEKVEAYLQTTDAK